ALHGAGAVRVLAAGTRSPSVREPRRRHAALHVTVGRPGRLGALPLLRSLRRPLDDERRARRRAPAPTDSPPDAALRPRRPALLPGVPIVAAGGRSGLRPHLLDRLEITRLPRAVEGPLFRAVDAEVREPSLFGDRLDPLGFLALRRLRSEV